MNINKTNEEILKDLVSDLNEILNKSRYELDEGYKKVYTINVSITETYNITLDPSKNDGYKNPNNNQISLLENTKKDGVN